ncbi:MOSC domain-containing protein YiiM [Salirhabdus euzebyi]|uniref:MOSC domain-containing protein YiiM n=1 Tax=Salirhabdus euzebyi TaxID=394506 RepID=A0A841PXZ7_9BACI|nr:MOSC domain-containing protein [Salirhabdus euzebyi]MBB6452426.1 MOSC domain-containing protein YiiM [Salirhabdus euzebyi]
MHTITKKYTVKSLNLGKIETHTYGKQTFDTAIRKKSLQEPIFLSKIGLVGDEHAYKQHGGEDKALCLYPYDYYTYWEDILSNVDNTAIFGENVTVIGLTEDVACIGDVFSYGEAVIQVTEPRVPCYKLAARYEVPDMVNRMVDKGYTGFMFRVLQEGIVTPTDELILKENHPQQVTVSMVNEVRYKDRENVTKIEHILAVEELAGSMRETLEKQLKSIRNKNATN